MPLDVSGHPFHTRSLDPAVRADDRPGRLSRAGELLDVRKRGFVPVAGRLQTAGPSHPMRIHAPLDGEARRSERIAGSMPRVGFEASDGGTCRDVAGPLADLTSGGPRQ